jgi:hypothetical protein
VSTVCADHISINEIAKLLGRLRGHQPTAKPIGSMDELKAKTDAARAKGNVGWDVMPL